MSNVRYDPRSALVVVDMQNDFVDRRGSLYVGGGDRVVAAVNREISRAVADGALVVYSRDWHPPETPHFQKFGGKWPVHCVRGTWGAEFHPDLEIVGDAEHIKKATGPEDGYSAFSVQHLRTGATASTGLAELLRRRGIRRVVIVGVATDYCVLETGRDAMSLGYAVTVVHDAIRAVDLEPGDGERALEELERGGADVVAPLDVGR
jgi:nicotinamidase/pyrazinamidase